MQEMSHRQRVLAALRHREPDRVPMDLGSTCDSTILAVSYQALRRQLGLAPGTTRVVDVCQQGAIIEEDVRRALGVDVAPVLVVAPDGTVVPMTHEVDPSLALGSVLRHPLALLARRWLHDGRADVLAEACERTLTELVRDESPAAVYWYDEVAARTRARRSRRLLAAPA